MDKMVEEMDKNKMYESYARFNPELAEKCGKKAQEVLIRFAPQKLLNRWNEYLHSVIANKK